MAEGTTEKPGYKTTEFWLSFLAMLVGAALASGVIEATSTQWDDKAIGLLVTVLSALGYTVSRTFVKKSG